MNIIKKSYDIITRDCWTIGFVENGINAVMDRDEFLKVNWLEHNYKDRWFADPFIHEVTETEIIVLAEEFQYATNKGRIAELIVDRTSYALKNLNIILELDTHLSFPAIWREGNQVFIYPESWMSGALNLYKYRGRGQKIEMVKKLCDESMADAIMTEHFGKKMLLSTKKDDELLLYYYNDSTNQFVFSEEIKFNESTARNAGDYFEYGGRFYRPAQVCTNHYGEAVEIQEIKHEKDGLFFKPIKRLYSHHPKLRTGLHTLNNYKDVTVIDVHGWVNPFAVNLILKTKKMLGLKNGCRKNKDKN